MNNNLDNLLKDYYNVNEAILYSKTEKFSVKELKLLTEGLKSGIIEEKSDMPVPFGFGKYKTPEGVSTFSLTTPMGIGYAQFSEDEVHGVSQFLKMTLEAISETIKNAKNEEYYGDSNGSDWDEDDEEYDYEEYEEEDESFEDLSDVEDTELKPSMVAKKDLVSDKRGEMVSKEDLLKAILEALEF